MNKYKVQLILHADEEVVADFWTTGKDFVLFLTKHPDDDTRKVVDAFPTSHIRRIELVEEDA